MKTTLFSKIILTTWRNPIILIRCRFNRPSHFDIHYCADRVSFKHNLSAIKRNKLRTNIKPTFQDEEKNFHIHMSVKCVQYVLWLYLFFIQVNSSIHQMYTCSSWFFFILSFIGLVFWVSEKRKYIFCVVNLMRS